MKKLLTSIMLIILTTVFAFGQGGPVTCNDLVIENLEMHNDSTMKITIRNNCDTCNWGAYCDIRIIQNSTDTIANSNCMCLFAPQPDTLTEYFLPSKVTTVPPINQLRVSHTCACDTIPFSPALGIILQTKKEKNFIFPNPFSTQTTFQTDNLLQNATLTVDNCFGQTVKQIKNISGQTITLHRDNLTSGLYFVRLTEDSKVIAIKKVVITD